MNTETLKKKTCAAIDALSDELVTISHAIHAKPELAFEEFFAAETLTDALNAHDLPVTRKAHGLDTAYVSEFGKGETTIGIISEYDALPGIGHACGHNIIAAAGLGATLALAKLSADVPAKIRYLGTPAEERGGGKEYMAQDGAFDGLDVAMMVHPAGADLITMPSLAMTEVQVVYHGRNAHAAGAPHEGLNALDALVSAYQSMAQLRQHIRPSERVHGIFTEAGEAPNIVPHRAAGLFYVRAADGVALAQMKKRVHACLKAGALATGCKADISWARVDYLEIKTAWEVARSYRENAESLGRAFFPIENLSAAGSTDMGNVSHRVPSIHPMIACAPPEITIHNPEFTRYAGSKTGDKAVIDGAKAMAMTAIDFATNKTLRAKTKADFQITSNASQISLESAWRADGRVEIGGCGCC